MAPELFLDGRRAAAGVEVAVPAGFAAVRLPAGALQRTVGR